MMGALETPASPLTTLLTAALPSPAPRTAVSCTCPYAHPYCWPDYGRCYLSWNSWTWPRLVCAGTCTANYILPPPPQSPLSVHQLPTGPQRPLSPPSVPPLRLRSSWSPSLPPSPPGLSTTTQLLTAVSNPAILHIKLGPGTFAFTSDACSGPHYNAALCVNRDVVIEAVTPGTVVLDARRLRTLLFISQGTVELIGLRIKGGNALRGPGPSVRAMPSNPHRLISLSLISLTTPSVLM
jgi:hypothetical protein